MLDKNHKDHPVSSMDKIGSYFVDKYLGVNVEVVYLLLLDNKYTAIDCIKIHEGSVNSAAITLRRLVEIALLRNASMVVLAHNHPSGLPIPSPDDLYTTKEIKRAFDLLDIKMLGHILVAGESYINLI
jgi:DNA repair protein RadC